ncbi:MAG: hypothetical protein COW30_03990 [Rhodospirillales bacterium CG15_BIG_FIL_POST_REV_8_21_14_020_66_15]|nr:MAG: hypothetical protein COW30_03990 [Rhodospirillales bacterium CG15_BIG_FIL_POST_REV_8_21_14_020_66_15]
MFTLSRINVVPAIVLGLTLAGTQAALAGSIYDTMSVEEAIAHQEAQLGQQEGQVVQPKQLDDNQLASAASTRSAEEFADFQAQQNVVTIVTQTPAGSDD